MGVRAALACAAAVLVTAAAASGGSVIATPISSDPYTNASSQHRTQVEPDSFGFGNTLVAAFQTGRFVNGGGASNIGWATTTNAGRTWTTGVLPGTTVFQGGPWSRISDPSVAYDPLHGVWMISTLTFGMGFTPLGSPSGILVSRSTDGGLTWESPVETFVGGFLDKNWITCDTWAQSPRYGNCYQEWDDFGGGGQIFMNRSTDGGLTWSTPAQPTGSPTGLGGQPVVQPNGNVIVPYEGGPGISAFRSIDGGVTWQDVVSVASVTEHGVAGNLRTSPLPSAEVDAAGKVYVVWQDCRFRSGCTANDIVMSTSTSGTSWTAPARIPIDATNSGVDHFIPGIGVDRSTSGGSARLALAYYYYPVAACNASNCDLTVGFTSSTDGGTTWAQPRKVAGPFRMDWIAQTDQGPMVGDYISTSFAGGPLAFPVFMIAKPPTGALFDERAASARFDVTVPSARLLHVRRDPIRYRPHRRTTPELARRN
jgi:BNR repeat-like domain